ncbi:DUF7344 domain-containing protein [Natrononativus amylolyticus]|uniref:DUF7344 domain-containing protein n=1 Tax=Natrononativus amylolyticus TaxID=2963434 RepID=UPI0020CC8822|nr:ArsR family transcriptional regulator [Natrononativus amylolyticus]
MLGQTFQILANKHRRRLLTELLHSRGDGSICVPEEVVDEEQTLENADVALRHQHLPLLEEAQFVRWNTDTQTVERGAKFDEICPLLTLLTANSQTLPGEWV